jgi:hypothetical protein
MSAAGRDGEAEAIVVPADPSPTAGVDPAATVTVAVRPWPLPRSIASAATMTIVATISGSTFRIAERRSRVPYLRCVRFQLPRSNIEISKKWITAATKPPALNQPNPPLLSALRGPSSLRFVSAGGSTSLIAPRAAMEARLTTPFSPARARQLRHPARGERDLLRLLGCAVG